MKETVRSVLLQYLQNKAGGEYGGILEDYVRKTLGAKASNASRTLRQMENDGLLIVDLVQIDGKGPHVCYYTYKPSGKHLTFEAAKAKGQQRLL